LLKVKRAREYLPQSSKEKKNMGIQITQVDAFTDQAFSGNPAAVCSVVMLLWLLLTLFGN
jgi:hypothetical protein